MTTTPDFDRIARLLDQRAEIDRQLADEFRLGGTGEHISSSDPLRPLNLGSAQQAIVDQLAQTQDMSPREITQSLDRGDEPNVRQTLERLEKRGVVERVPNLPTQRWRLSALYLNS